MPEKMTETLKQFLIESDFESFKDFLDTSWFEEQYSRVTGSDIEDPFDQFTTHWWGASRAFVMPWLFVNGNFDAMNDGSGQARKKQQLWDQYLEINAFKGALWKIAESTYSSIYYAYENLIVSTVNTRRNPPLRVTSRNFNSSVSQHYGAPLAGKIWNNSYLSLTREVRNCLVHNGGHASEKLRGMRPLPRIEGKDIIISATDARKLYQALRPKVELVVEHHAQTTS